MYRICNKMVDGKEFNSRVEETMADTQLEIHIENSVMQD